MASTIIDSIYYRDFFGTEPMRRIFSDQMRFQKWIEVEIALAEAQAELNIIPKEAAQKIKTSLKLDQIDLKEMKTVFDQVGFPILPFVKQLNKLCDPETAKWIHYGATTQDILDTGTVLQIKEGLKIIERDLNSIIEALATLSKTHKETTMAGRTFQQIAAPITFGFKTAVWLNEIIRHRERLLQVKERVLVGNCSGAVGTFASMDKKGIEVQKIMMQKLGLKAPEITWHTSRDMWSEVIFVFTMISSTFAKIANEVAILMRSEIAELSEPYEKGRGASSTMPQKRNPISCEPIIAIAPKMRSLLNEQLSAMVQEHERGVGQMNIEWITIPEAFIYMSATLKHTHFILANLEVYPENMQHNLSQEGGLIMAEAVMMGLAPKLGKSKAHQLVSNAARIAYENKITLKESILNIDEITALLTESAIDELLQPINYIGNAREMIDNVIKKA